MKGEFKMLEKEERQRKFIFSYGVGEAFVETENGTKSKEGNEDRSWLRFHTAMVLKSHNEYLDDYFKSIDPTEECSLIKGQEHQDEVKELYKEYIGMAKVYYADSEEIKAWKAREWGIVGEIAFGDAGNGRTQGDA
ncbi:hypothetical protein Tco_0549481 [Tanacetum coccineum]